jgi:hypothetical protein
MTTKLTDTQRILLESAVKTNEEGITAYSDVIRPLIPIAFGHRFRWDSATHSEAIRPPSWAGATRGNSTMIHLFFGARGGSGAVIHAQDSRGSTT